MGCDIDTSDAVSKVSGYKEQGRPVRFNVGRWQTTSCSPTQIQYNSKSRPMERPVVAGVGYGYEVLAGRMSAVSVASCRCSY